MTAQDFRELANYLGLPDFLLAVLAAAFIGLGFWARGYFLKKGENFATKEDFDELLKQTKKMTVATEGIRSELVYKSWHNQQHWTSKEKYYMDILRHLTICRNTLLDRLDYYQEPGAEHDDNCTKNEHFLELSQRAFESFSAVRVLTGPASVFLTETTIKNLEELDSGHWDVANWGAACVKEYLDSTLILVNQAFTAILEDARADLGKAELTVPQACE